jgi:NO-binding membrane sensor protein with MHYT domain
MQAFHLPVTVSYYWPTVLAALMIAIIASAAALYFGFVWGIRG